MAVVIVLTLLIVGVVGWWVTLKPKALPASAENPRMMQQMQKNMPGQSGGATPKPADQPAH